MSLKRFNPSYAAPVAAKDHTGWATPIKAMILDHLNNRPRSTQTALGPSSAGNPCDRALVGLMSGFAGAPDSNPWLAGVGVAVHFMLAEMLDAENQKAVARGEKKPWLVEQDLDIKAPAIPKGSGDAFHIPTGTVVDWKILGKTTLDEINKNGPGDVYETQLHIYGFGYAKLGYQVNDVVLAALPRNANPNLPFLHEAVFWKQAWDFERAVDAITRVETLYLKAKELKAAQNVRKLQLVPATPGKACYYCPFKSNSNACPDAVSK